MGDDRTDAEGLASPLDDDQAETLNVEHAAGLSAFTQGFDRSEACEPERRIGRAHDRHERGHDDAFTDGAQRKFSLHEPGCDVPMSQSKDGEEAAGDHNRFLYRNFAGGTLESESAT